MLRGANDGDDKEGANDDDKEGAKRRLQRRSEAVMTKKGRSDELTTHNPSL